MMNLSIALAIPSNHFYFTPNFEEHTIQIIKKKEDLSELLRSNEPNLGHNKIDENSQNLETL
jgi:hypothetical protein